MNNFFDHTTLSIRDQKLMVLQAILKELDRSEVESDLDMVKYLANHRSQVQALRNLVKNSKASPLLAMEVKKRVAIHSAIRLELDIYQVMDTKTYRGLVAYINNYW